MTAQLRPTKNDDLAFIRLLKGVVEGILGETESDELYVVAIDNWFDQENGLDSLASVWFLSSSPHLTNRDMMR